MAMLLEEPPTKERPASDLVEGLFQGRNIDDERGVAEPSVLMCRLGPSDSGELVSTFYQADYARQIGLEIPDGQGIGFVEHGIPDLVAGLQDLLASVSVENSLTNRSLTGVTVIAEVHYEGRTSPNIDLLEGVVDSFIRQYGGTPLAS